ncbi:hypothetical protein Tco_0863567 [Tanacetum coccineum]
MQEELFKVKDGEFDIAHAAASAYLHGKVGLSGSNKAKLSFSMENRVMWFGFKNRKLCVTLNEENKQVKLIIGSANDVDNVGNNEVLLLPTCRGSLCNYPMDWYHAVGVICVQDAGGKLGVHRVHESCNCALAINCRYMNSFDHNVIIVRKQAATTLQNMEALVREQSSVTAHKVHMNKLQHSKNLVVSNGHCNEKCEETLQHEPYGTSEEPEEVLEGRGQGELKPSKVLKLHLKLSRMIGRIYISLSSSSVEKQRSDVFVNGKLLTDQAVKKAEKLAAPIHPARVLNRPGKGEVRRFVNQTSSIFSMTLGKRELTTSFRILPFRFLSTAIALQTSVVAAQGLHVWTVYILRCPARRLQQLYGVPIVLKRTWIDLLYSSIFVVFIAFNQIRRRWRLCQFLLVVILVPPGSTQFLLVVRFSLPGLLESPGLMESIKRHSE